MGICSAETIVVFSYRISAPGECFLNPTRNVWARPPPLGELTTDVNSPAESDQLPIDV